MFLSFVTIMASEAAPCRWGCQTPMNFAKTNEGQCSHCLYMYLTLVFSGADRGSFLFWLRPDVLPPTPPPSLFKILTPSCCPLVYICLRFAELLPLICTVQDVCPTDQATLERSIASVFVGHRWACCTRSTEHPLLCMHVNSFHSQAHGSLSA